MADASQNQVTMKPTEQWQKNVLMAVHNVHLRHNVQFACPISLLEVLLRKLSAYKMICYRVLLVVYPVIGQSALSVLTNTHSKMENAKNYNLKMLIGWQ